MTMSDADEQPTHDLLDALSVGDTVRVELDDETVVGEVDETRHHTEGAVVGQGVTLIEEPDGLNRSKVWDLDAQYDPRDGWSSVEASQRSYGTPETEWIDKGAVETLTPISLGIEPDRLDPGVTVEGVDGDHYRVVVPPWEREYDDKALTYNLDSPSNACEKLDPEEVVRRVE